jgi:hypothetical protein
MGWKEYALPTLAVAAGVPVMTGGAVGGTTFKTNAGRHLRELPSLTQMPTPLKVPVCPGVPASFPVEELKLAHHGLLLIENVSLPWAASLAVG